MDAFFAAVEVRDNPELKGKPVIVGGTSGRGVVSAASYEARPFGVRSGMAMATARRLCPRGVFVPLRGGVYGEASRQVFAIIRERVPVVEKTSVDEGYLDLTGTERLLGPPEEAMALLKQDIRAATGLTCSVGIAPNKFLAKVASEEKKPDGLFVLRPGDVPGFLAGLAVEKIPGVGPSTRESLELLGVYTCGDVLARGLEFWSTRGELGLFLWQRAMGEHDSPVRAERGEPKSISAENTFAEDTADAAELSRWLLLQAERVGQELREEGFFCRTVTVKLKYADFAQHTRSATLKEGTRSTEDVFAAACRLLAKAPLKGPLRLIGLGVSGLHREKGQLRLLPDTDALRREALDQALDKVREKFGRSAVRRGRVFGFRE